MLLVNESGKEREKERKRERKKKGKNKMTIGKLLVKKADYCI